MLNDYARNMSRNIYDSKQEGTGLRILTLKQMFQRLPISLAQIKAGNNSQSLFSLCINQRKLPKRHIIIYLNQ